LILLFNDKTDEEPDTEESKEEEDSFLLRINRFVDFELLKFTVRVFMCCFIGSFFSSLKLLSDEELVSLSNKLF